MMKRKIQVALLTAALTVSVAGTGLLAPQKAEASGFPTVDIAALVQRITGYSTQLQEYAQALTQTTTQVGQLVQLYKDYEQVLREYDHFLRQLRGLRNFISNADWQDLMELIAPYYGASDFALIAELDPRSAGFENDVRELLDRYTTVPRKETDFDGRLAAIGAEDAEHYRAQNRRMEAAYSRQLDIYRQVSRNEDDAKGRDEDIAEFGRIIKELGDESDVATMQTIATGVQMQLSQSQAALRLQNQILLNTELPSAMRATDKARALDKEIARLEFAIENPLDSFTVNTDDF
jgi:hypothetical protein